MSVPRSVRHRLLLTVLASALLVPAACGRRTSSTTPTTPTITPTTAAVGTTTPATIADTTTTFPVATTVATTTTTAVATTTTQDVATATAEITTNWERFFLPSTAISDRVALLENGPALQQALEQRSQDPLMLQASATVTQVDLTAPDRATVTYDVSLNGTVALADAQGVAVLQDGVWKVGADSFCALISLGATEPIPGCS